MGFVSFNFSNYFRTRYIAEHNFYIEQAKIKLLSSFDNIDKDANQYAEEWIEERVKSFDPYTQDPDAIIEQAEHESIYHFIALDNMKRQTYLSVVAGMFHQFDKTLREWLSKELDYLSKNGENTRFAIWNKDFPLIIDLLDNLGFNISANEFYKEIEICHLVVNVYKHGNGRSFEELKELRPNFFYTKYDKHFSDEMKKLFIFYEHLEILDEEITNFSNAIISFWNFIPENVHFSQTKKIPNWLDKAIEKDLEIKNNYIRII